MIFDLGKETEFWKFIGGNFSIYVGRIKNVGFLDINGETHYRFDLNVLAGSGEGRILEGIISCPYLQMKEEEHRLIHENSRVTIVAKLIPKIPSLDGRFVLESRRVALKIEGDMDVFWKFSRRVF